MCTIYVVVRVKRKKKTEEGDRYPASKKLKKSKSRKKVMKKKGSKK
jgi:hypothetical protein